jgi:alanine dehydrogenase
MRIGVPRETKEGERRVALLPREVRALALAGHRVHMESGAGRGVDVDDDAYREAGASVGTAADAWSADLVVKVKELLARDLAHAPRGATVFGFQQLPGAPERTRAVAERALTAIAFELVHDDVRGYPLLAPMSVIAGRMGVEAVWRFLPQTPNVLVLGAGHAGMSAARTARERGAHVSILTRSTPSRDAARREGFAAEQVSAARVEEAALAADLVVGAVWVPGQPTPKLLARGLVQRMRRGAVLADICIDGGGVSETSQVTTHAEPTRVVEGVVHYGIPNIPGADPQAATRVLSQALLPFVSALASLGVARAIRERADLRAAVLVWKGQVNDRGIADEAGLPYVPLAAEALA